MTIQNYEVSEDVPDELLDEYNSSFKTLILAGLSRVIDKIAPWFDPLKYELEQGLIVPDAPNIELLFCNKDDNDKIQKLISVEWLQEELINNHSDIIQEMQNIQDDFIINAERYRRN